MTLRQSEVSCEYQSVHAEVAARKQAILASQLANPTQKNKFGFKFTQKQKTKDAEREHQNMSVLALDVLGRLSRTLSK